MLITSSAKVSEHSSKPRSRGSLRRLSVAVASEEKTSSTRGGNTSTTCELHPNPTDRCLLPPEPAQKSPDEGFMSRLLGGGTPADSCPDLQSSALLFQPHYGVSCSGFGRRRGVQSAFHEPVLAFPLDSQRLNSAKSFNPRTSFSPHQQQKRRWWRSRKGESRDQESETDGVVKI